jgi:hypothetical protein
MSRFNSVMSSFDANAKALSEDELRALAPSIFATTAHESRSERFRPIPTIEVIKGLAKEGFSVVSAKQAVTRDPGKAAFTKHLLRLRRLDKADEYIRDGVAFEVLLKNANDGTSAYDLFAGFLRFICTNGLVCGDKLSEVKVRHSGNVVDKVVEGTYTVLNTSQRLLEAPALWSGVRMDRDEVHAFATAAHALRFDEPEEGQKPTIEPQKLLTVHREEDTAPNLWNVFNIVQENAIKGGLTGKSTNAETGQTRRVRTREVKGIDQDVKLNKGLWVLAEFFASQRNAGLSKAA